MSGRALPVSARLEKEGRRMKVLDEAAKGLVAGTRVSVREWGLPVTGNDGVLVVFWKER